MSAFYGPQVEFYRSGAPFYKLAYNLTHELSYFTGVDMDFTGRGLYFTGWKMNFTGGEIDFTGHGLHFIGWEIDCKG